jgi:hypothetical protein
MFKNGLILVWDLDQTLIGWSADNKTYTINSMAVEILSIAFQYHIDFSSIGAIRKIIVLTNNSEPWIPVKEIETLVGHKFDYVIERGNTFRDTTNPLLKDMDTIRRIVGYNVHPNDVWIMDDIKHKMVDEGAHWIKIKQQIDNPFDSGFFKNPDETDYVPLMNAIHKKGLKLIKTRRNKRKERRSKRKVRKFDSRIQFL